jgi:tetratricopeptide (TPR) repeat protein
LGDVNDNVGDHTTTLRYYKQALNAAQQVDNKLWMVQTLNNIATTFDLLGENDSLKYYIEQAKPYVASTEGEVRASFLVNNASYLMRTGKMAEAKRFLAESMQVCPTDRGEKLLSNIFVQEGDTASAMTTLYRLTSSLSPDVAIQSYQMLIEHMNRRGDTKNAAEYSQRLNNVYSSLYERNDDAGIIDMMAQFDEQMQERKQYRTVIALLTVIILLMIISALLVWYSRHRIDKLNARFAESQQQYNLTRSELTRMRQQKEREQRENSSQMKETVSRLHASANKGKPVTDADANDLAQLSFAQNAKLRELLSTLNSREQTICLLTILNFQPTEIAVLTISTPQAITNTRVRLLKKLFGVTGGAKDFDNAIKQVH